MGTATIASVAVNTAFLAAGNAVLAAGPARFRWASDPKSCVATYSPVSAAAAGPPVAAATATAVISALVIGP